MTRTFKDHYSEGWLKESLKKFGHTFCGSLITERKQWTDRASDVEQQWEKPKN